LVKDTANPETGPVCVEDDEAAAPEEVAAADEPTAPEDAAPEDLALDDATLDDVAPEESASEDVEGAVDLLLLPHATSKLAMARAPINRIRTFIITPKT
jgi:hypothetical protein